MASSQDATTIRQLEEEAARAHIEAQRLNAAGRYQEAKEAYGRMHVLEDRALVMVLSTATHDPTPDGSGTTGMAVGEGYDQVVRSTSGWPDTVTRERAKAAILGAIVGDAAAMGVHWVYDTEVLATLLRQRQEQGEEGLEFFELPQSPFFSYESGRPSPYGEQTLVLLRSMVQEGGVHAVRYACSLARVYGRGWDGYRDASIKGFLRRFCRGSGPPDCGIKDHQANCFTRTPIIAAMYAGDTSTMLTAVERACRVTQNDDIAVAYGRASARVLELCILNATGSSSSSQSHTRCDRQKARGEGGGDGGGGGDDGINQQHGMYQCGGSGGGSGCGGSGCSEGSGDSAAKRSSGGAASFRDIVEAVVRELDDEGSVVGGKYQDTNEEIAHFLRACVSLRYTDTHAAVGIFGRNCHLPQSLQTPVQTVLHTLEQAKTVSPSHYTHAVRAALREGGCCASRATFAGACVGAMVEGGIDAVPESWKGRVKAYRDIEEMVENLLSVRDGL